MISTATSAVNTITVGAGPAGVGITPDGTAVYVANNQANDAFGTVSVISTATSTATATITDPSFSNPEGVLVFTPAAPLTLTTTSLPGATLGSAYSATVTATGGTSPYTWSVTSGALPPGLSLSPSGTISGTPAVAGTFPVTIQVSDSSSPAQTATAALSITVGAGPGGTVITGTHSGPLNIGPGVTILSGATVTGPVTIAAGAIVSITGSTLSGPLTAHGPGSLALCGSKVTGPAMVTGDTGQVLIGGGSGSPCAANTISGPVTLNSNTGGVTVAGNTISGTLSCSSNNPAPTDNGQPNTAKSGTGQCTSLV